MEMTLEELNRAYERLRAVREIENMMGRYSFFHTAMRHIDYLKLWSKRDDCILDMPWGSYTGYQGVKTCYLEDHGDLGVYGRPVPNAYAHHRCDRSGR